MDDGETGKGRGKRLGDDAKDARDIIVFSHAISFFVRFLGRRG